MGSLFKPTLKFYFFSLLLLAALSSPAVLNAATLNLTWNDNSTNEDGFSIERRSGTSGSFTQIATVGPNITSYTNSNLAGGSVYCYQVRAFNSSGDSSYSNGSCATAIDNDTDGDGLTDADEANIYGTDPLLADTDGDGLSDGNEVNINGTDPLLADTDGDGASDGLEISQGTDPLDPDSNLKLRAVRWTDYRITLNMESGDNGAIGVLFRYLNNNNYYRFSWDSGQGYRRLIKREFGEFTLLAEDAVPYIPGQTYRVEIVAQGSTLQILIDGALIVSVTDSSIPSGSIGLYSSGNEGSQFDDIVVEDLSTGDLLLSNNFNSNDINGWTFLDEGTIGGPSVWSAATGTLVQSSPIISSNPNDPSDLAKLGSLALYKLGMTLTFAKDFTGDGITDLLVRDSTGRLLLYEWLYDQWGFIGKIGRGWNFTDFFTGDFTGDGIADLMVRDTGGALHLYQWGGNRWVNWFEVSNGMNFTDYLPADFTGDGVTDLMVRDSLGRLHLYEWLNNRWGFIGQIGTGWNFTDFIVGDFTGDGIADLMVRDTGGALHLYQWGGNRWINWFEVSNGMNFTDYLPADFTGDGVTDLMVRDSLGRLHLYEWLIDRWGFIGQIGSGWNFTDFFTGDFTGDGIADLMVRDTGGTLRLFQWGGNRWVNWWEITPDW